jgi:hypothetical protein
MEKERGWKIVMRKAFIVFVLMAAVSGCAAKAGSRKALIQTASRDMDCPGRRLDLTALEDRVNVNGCGKKAVYGYSHERKSWVLSSEIFSPLQ